MRDVRTTCPYCGTGCGVIASTDGASIVSVRGDPEHPANRGRLCTKGSTLASSARPGGRLLVPELRTRREAPRHAAGWDEALDFACTRFAQIVREHGPDAVAFYGSGQLLTEDYYVLNKLARAVVGTNNLDTNSRLCMSSAVAGYKATLGADAVPACYDDIEAADLFFVAGSNTAWAHPIVMRRIEAARAARPHARMIVVDPRRTATAQAADLHLPILPGTDVALFHAMLHWLFWEDRVASDFLARHCDGVPALRAAVRETSPRAAAAICGVREADIVTAARWWADAGAVLSLYCQGLNQSTSGTDKNATLVTLHLATAQIGRPGAGPLSLTGQPNAMGGREVGALANLLPGHRDAGDAADRDAVARAWGVEALPARPGATAVEMFERLREGTIRAVWIVCTNPADSMPDTRAVREALARAELVVVQDAFASSTTLAYADVALPASTWGEKEGTVTNSERRVSRVRAVLDPPGQARHDWRILRDAARRLERALHPERRSGFGFDSPQAIWLEHRELTRGRDLDITGLDWARLDADGPQQWPFPEGAARGAARLFADGRFAHPDGRARLCAAAWRPLAEPVDARFPLALTTGRLRDQWHTMTRTGRVAALADGEDSPRLSMNPNDLARRAIDDGALVEIASRRGRFVAIVTADSNLRGGQAFLPMHWGDASVAGRGLAGVNAIAQSARDPVSRQPELKHSAVRVRALAVDWHVGAVVRADPATLDALRARLLAHAAPLALAWVVPVEDAHAGLWLRGAAHGAPDSDWLDALDRLLGLDGNDVLRYDDPGMRRGRRVRVDGDALVAARVCGPIAGPAADAFSAARALRDLLAGGASVRSRTRALLAPGALPAAPAIRTLCVCHGVREADARDALAAAEGDAHARLRHAQATTRCGTGCGSCLPELGALALEVAGASAEAAARAAPAATAADAGRPDVRRDAPRGGRVAA